MTPNHNLHSPESVGGGLPRADVLPTFAFTETDGKWARLVRAGHFPTLISSFLYFDYSFMVWTLLGVLGAQIASSLHLSADQKYFMVSVPVLAGGLLRLVLGLIVDRIGAKATGIIAQLIVISGLALAWQFGLKDFPAALMLGAVLGFAGASFAVALPQAGRWYPPQMQGVVMGIAGAGNIGVVIDALCAPRLAAAYGWQQVFGLALIPAIFVLGVYVMISKEPPAPPTKKQIGDYIRLFSNSDVLWFCLFYLVTFGGFVGLAYSLGLYFKDRFGVSPQEAGDLVALCTGAGSLCRPLGGALADRVGGIKTLYVYYSVSAAGLIGGAIINSLALNTLMFVIACAAFGMGNGSVFQLLPQRFGKEIGLLTGVVGCCGGLGGFLLANLIGQSKQHTGSYLAGFICFAGLCAVAMTGLSLVKNRWRTTWGAQSQAKI